MSYLATVKFDKTSDMQHQFLDFCLEVLSVYRGERFRPPRYAEYVGEHSYDRGFVHFGKWRTAAVYGPLRTVLNQYTDAFSNRDMILSEETTRNGRRGRYAAVDLGEMTTVFFMDGTSSRFIRLLK